MQNYTFVQIMSRTTVVGIYFRLCRSLKCRVVTRTEFTLGAWVVAESDVVFTPRGMYLIYICVHIFAAPLWCVGLANPKQFSVIYSFIDHRGTVWKCSKLKRNRVVSLQSDQQRTTNCVAWFDINSRVATVREKRGKNENFSRSGKSQGIF